MAAFEALYARHQPAVLSFCRHLTGSREDAEDAVQHTFLAAYRQLVEGGTDLDLRPWLFTVARNRCLSLLRARREAVAGDPEVVSPSFDGLAAEVERRQELRDLVRDMGRLPEPQRAALVLSQLDALSYREIGGVLEVSPEKVKALVFQARSSLVSSREARDASCVDIREQIATARGSSLRRRLLRRHVSHCSGCRDYETAVLGQRRDLEVLLPVVPSAGLAQAILGATAGKQAAALGTAAGGAGGGLTAVLGGLGLQTAAKLAIVVAVAGGGTAGAAAADLPQRLGDAAPWSPAGGAGGERHEPSGDRGLADAPGQNGGVKDGADGGGRDAPGDGSRGGEGDDGRRGEEGADGSRADEPVPGDPGRGADDGPAQAGAEGAGGGGREDGLPPGLAKKDELPPGLAKRDELPPGLAKQGGGGPANGHGSAGSDGGAGGNGGGKGRTGPATGVGQGNGNGNSAPPGQGNGTAQGGAGGNGVANGNGPGGSSAGGNGGNSGGGNGKGKP